MKSTLLVLLVFVALVGVSTAQDTLPATQGAPRALALSIVNEALVASEVGLPDNTLTVDFNPVDSTRTARTDQNGLIRYAPPGISEGVFTFSPFMDGFAVGSPTENKLFVQQVAWSPSGTQIAFVINTPNFQEPGHGVWFWQPARELATDPSYQLLRQCPPSCAMTANVDGIEWYARRVEWSPDNTNVLVSMTMPKEGRSALAVRTATRDSQIANTPPKPLRYDTGHWVLGGGAIVVSGTNPQGTVGFGTVSNDGTVLSFTPVTLPVAAWVQDAVQAADGRFYMFGTTVGRGSPLMLMDDSGRPLTPLIGGSAPTLIDWNDERTAARVISGGSTYIVQINGTVTDITPLTAGISAVGWASTPPANGSALIVPEPLATGGNLPVKVGDILRVVSNSVTIYSEPIDGATVLGSLAIGEELIIVSDAVQNGEVSWWKVQSINFSGWINSTADVAISTVEG
jgi:hypothetical protein